MNTNLVIDVALLERAFHVSGLQSEEETVHLALKEFISKRAKEDVISLFNSVEYDPDYDYKKLRSKR